MALTEESALRKDQKDADGRIDSMQHRHYAVIAGIVAQIHNKIERSRIAYHFAGSLRINSNFDEARFFRACGVSEVK